MLLTTNRTKVLFCTLCVAALSACGLGGSKQDIRADNAQSRAHGAPVLKHNEDVLQGKLAPPKGLNQDNLFSPKIKNNDERFARLEQAVQAIYDSLNAHLPAIEKLSVIEGDIQELVGQLQTLVLTEGEDLEDIAPEPTHQAGTPPRKSPAPIQPAVAAKTATPVALHSLASGASEAGGAITTDIITDATDAQAVAGAGTTMPPPNLTPKAAPQTPPALTPTNQPATARSTEGNIRVSQDAQKTRIVFDTPHKVEYALDYDAQENVVFVTANNVQFSKTIQEAAKKSSHIRSITATEDDNSINIILELEGVNFVSDGKLLPPNQSNNQFRYYFDLN